MRCPCTMGGVCDCSYTFARVIQLRFRTSLVLLAIGIACIFWWTLSSKLWLEIAQNNRFNYYHFFGNTSSELEILTNNSSRPVGLENACESSDELFVDQFSCAKHFYNYSQSSDYVTYVNKLKRLFKHTPSISYHADDYYLRAAADCDAFKIHFGYRTSLMEGDDPDFPIAFNVLTHRSMAQVERLLRAIYRPHNSYCIHVDAVANEMFQRALRAVVSCFDNVFVASKLEAIVYAGYSRLQADVNCMKDHLKSTIKWRYLINTASNAYPLKTNAEITKIFKIYNGANDIKAAGFAWTSNLKERWELEHIEPSAWNKSDDRMLMPYHSGRKLPKPPHNLTIVKGSAYGSFSRAFVDYLINDNVAKDYLHFCRRTYSPDEHYWNTLHHTYYNPHIHPPGSYSGNPTEKPWLAAHVVWTYYKSPKCYGESIRSHCLYGIGDLPFLIVRPEILANRIDVTFEPLTIDCLEAWHRRKEQCPPAFDEKFYKSLPFIYKDYFGPNHGLK